MTRDLYQTIPVYREQLDACLALAEELSQQPLRRILFPDSGGEKEAESLLSRTDIALPIVFSVAYALGKSLQSWGIRPFGMLGHSVAEYVAACLADVFKLEDALRVFIERGRLAQGLPPGAMLAVALPAADVELRLSPGLSLGSTLTSQQCVVSGLPEEIERLSSELERGGVDCRRIPVGRAFHSAMLDPILEDFRQTVASVPLRPPSLPFISCLTGDWITSQQAQSPDYWMRQFRSTVRFHEGCQRLAESNPIALVEIGGRALFSSVLQQPTSDLRNLRCLSLSPHRNSSKDEVEHLAQSLQSLQEAGLPLNVPPQLAATKLDSPAPVPAQPPSSPSMDLALKAFKEILGRADIERDENFIELGGNSLLAMQAIARLRKQTGAQISIRDFLDNPTAAGVAQLIDGGAKSPAPATHDRTAAKAAPCAGSFSLPDLSHLQFSLFFFSANENASPDDRYKLVTEAARLADLHGLTAIWTPERHFNTFGGLYPNPAVLGAALAASTNRIQIRGGSVVAPLHHPVRIAEEWSVVDNLSRGRIGIAFGSGFHPNDFLFAPSSFSKRREEMFQSIEAIHSLWQGGSFKGLSGDQQEIEVKLLPRPYSPTLPTWLATTRDPSTFIEAGKRGYHVLTALLRLSIPELKERVELYRAARAEAGHDPSQGIVSVMLHAFLGPDEEYVKAKAEAPLRDYLRSHLLHTQAVSREKSGQTETLSPEDEEALLDQALQRYYRRHSLIGTPQSCLPRLAELAQAGADEIACLIDFGVETEAVLHSIGQIASLQGRCRHPAGKTSAATSDSPSRPSQATRAAMTQSCLLVGEGMALAQAADILRESGFRIQGIASTDESLAAWAGQEGLAIHRPNQLADLLAEQAVDYLVSLYNPAILKPDVLSLPRKGIINFHPSPLPRYAGPNPIPWAILQGETDYAVTWHWIDEGIDSGPIVQQSSVPVRPDDTSLSLILRCVETGMKALRELAPKLPAVPSQPQDLSQRSYYPAKRRPAHACILDFDLPASELSALARALHFGPLDNRFDTLKLWTGDGLYIVGSLEIDEAKADTESFPPGAFLGRNGDRLLFATSDQPIAIANLKSLDGIPLGSEDFLQQSGLQPGQVLPHLSEETRRRISKITTKAQSHDDFWVPRLASAKPLRLKSLPDPDGPPLALQRDLPLPADFSKAVRDLAPAGVGPHDALLTAWAAFLALRFQQARFDIAYQPEGNERQASLDVPLTAPLVPFPFSVDPLQSFSALLSQAASERRQIESHPIFTRDIFARFAKLRSQAATIHSHASFLRQAETGDVLPRSSSHCALLLSDDPSRVHIAFSNSLSPDLADELAHSFSAFLTRLLDRPREPIEQLWPTPPAARPSQSSRPDIQPASPPQQAFPLLHELFEEQAAKTPGDIAVAFQDQTLSFEQLNAKANQLARHLLQQQGQAKPNAPVGLLLDPSFAMVIAMLATLKAGRAYLPLDPSYPKDRLRHMIDDSGLRIILTTRASQKDVDVSKVSVCLLDDFSELDSQPSANLSLALDPEAPAYVIYTSGSTGRPKGAVIPHRAISNHMLWMRRRFPVDRNDRILQKTALSFDASGWEIYLPLITGARMALADPNSARDPSLILEQILELGITHVQFVPAVLEGASRLPTFAQCSSLRRIFSGGETLRADLANRVLDKLPVELINLYGPTEAAIDSSFFICSGPQTGSTVPIGQAIDGAELHLLDESRQPVPDGEVGELYIGGAGVGLGYLNHPELNEGAFLEDFLNPDSPYKLYRTGDRCRRLPCGNLEFVGRNDGQIKLRGNRIELGEVEAALARLPEVSNCAAALREIEPGDPQLIGYLEASVENESAFLAEARVQLGKRLLPHMIPTRFVFCDKLPLSPSGKVDRAALPNPPVQGPSRETASAVAPSSELEDLILQAWQQALGTNQISPQDDFFTLGGHSLKALQMIRGLQQRLGPSVSLDSIFTHPVFSDFVSALANLQGKKGAKAPLTAAQEQLWLIDQIEGSSHQYNLSSFFELKGPIDLPLLESCFNSIVQRHEILRARFAPGQEEPSQEFLDELETRIALIDLSDLPPPTRETELSNLMNRETEHRFSLHAAPLFRVRVVKLAEQRHILLAVFHHIIVDGPSLHTFYRELSELYRAGKRGEAPRLAPLPTTYSQHAIEQRAKLGGKEHQAKLSWWKDYLKDAPPLLTLPTDRPRLPNPPHRGDMAVRDLPPSLAKTLRVLGVKLNATPFTILLSGFNILLHRLANQDDLVVGIPSVGRERSVTESLVGMFVETIPLRSRLDPQQPARRYIEQLRNNFLDTFERSDVSLEHIVQEIQPTRSTLHSPVFQFVFNMVSFEEGALNLEGAESEELRPRRLNSKFDITFYARSSHDAVRLEAVFKTALFDRQTIDRLLEQYEWILQQIAERAEQPLGQLSLVTPSARPRLPDPTADLPEATFPTVSSQFIAQAAQQPDAIAIQQGDRAVSYRQLERLSANIARSLQEAKLQRGQPVAVRGPRSIGLIASALGVLRSGGVLLLVDPDLPAERQEKMLRAANAAALIRISDTDEPTSIAKSSAAPTAQILVSLQGELRQDGASKEHPLDTPDQARPADPAYLFFTSGTTGEPKAILGKHNSLSHFIEWERSELSLQPDDRVAQLTGLSFDVILRDIFLPLSSGATLVLPEDMGDFGRAPLRWLEQQRINILHTVPALAQSWLEEEEGQPGALADLRATLFAGEPLNSQLVEAWRKRLAPQAVIYNLYGPTETTLAKACHRVPSPTPHGRQSIGRPLPGGQILVLKQGGQLCGIGEMGELVIRTPYRTFGYASASPEDQSRFAPNPFTGKADDIVYYTGDVGAYLPDGSLRIGDRRDEQVKIRGLRIELGEISQALLERPDIASVHTLARQSDGAGEKQIVSYFVPTDSDAAPSFEELRAFLLTKLPAYMAPNAIVPLPSLPLTANGKIDRQALPAPAPRRVESSRPLRSETEKTIASIWQKILKVENIGPEDDFFALGGHSLKAIKAVSACSKTLQADIPLSTLFSHSRLEDFAQSIGKAERREVKSSAPDERPQSLPLTFSQQRLWFIDQFEGSSSHYNVPYGLHLRGSLDLEALRRALQSIVDRHDVLRARFVSEGGEPRQQIESQLDCPCPLYDLADLEPQKRKEELERLSDEAAYQPFDLSKPPLFRFRLLKTGDDEHILIYNFHHIIYDGWSMGIFYRELEALYQAYAKGQPSPLEPLSYQFTNYALDQRKTWTPDKIETELKAWKERLANPSDLELPLDYSRPAKQTYEGDRLDFNLSSEVGRQLEAFNRKAKTTPFMTFLAAFQALLSRWSGQDDILVGTPVANRQSTSVEGLIGFFVNTVVLRADFSRPLTFEQLVKEVRNQSLDVLQSQDFPFDKIVEALNPKRDLSRHPLFQACFAMQNTDGRLPDLEGLDVSLKLLRRRTTHFDLSLNLVPRPEGWLASLMFSTSLFSRSTIERLASHFEQFLLAALAEPERPLEQIDFLSRQERDRILSLSRAPLPDQPIRQPIHRLFQEQAARAPQAVALRTLQETVTYSELEEKSNRLARLLRSQGVNTGDRVGVYLGRSPSLIVSYLAILKCGGAYVPLAQDYPAERLAFMIEDADLRAIILQSEWPSELDTSQASLVRLDGLDDELAQLSGEPMAQEVAPDAPAYAIYTSGSTGQPKGALIPHRGVTRLVRDQSYAPFQPDQTFLLLASPSFDASTFEIWGPLLNGACCAIFEHDYPDFAKVEHAVKKLNVTCLWLTAGLFNSIVDHRPSAIETVSLVMTGGEALSPPHVKRALSLYPKMKLVNGYGPTECTTFATTFAIDRQSDYPVSVPIGKPIGRTQALVLDKRRQLSPLGVPGELYLGGDGLALEYLNQPELTQEKFVRNPFSSDPASRLYRTGDRVRLLPSGNIEFLGRFDQQMKIRGFRIEAGEVQSALLAHPAVRDAAVVAQTDASGTSTLVAFYTAEAQAQAADHSGILVALRKRLPNYAVPSRLVQVDHIPLTPNGKVDRAALLQGRTASSPLKAIAPSAAEKAVAETKEPQPASPSSVPPDAPEAPQTLLEHRLSQLWAELFGLPSVGRHDSFFELGGHSLLAAKLTAKISELTGHQLPIATLFQAPTVAELATILTDENQAPAWSSLVPLQTQGTEPPLFCLHGWTGEVYGFLDLARQLAPDRPVYGLQAVGMDGKQPKHSSIEQMAQLYVEEIMAVCPDGPYHLIGQSMGGWIAYAVALELLKRGKTIGCLGMLDTQALTKAPFAIYALSRAKILARRTLHHLARWMRQPAKEKKAYFAEKYQLLRFHLARGRGHHPVIKKLDELPDKPQDYYYFARVSDQYAPPKYPGDIYLFLCGDAWRTNRLYWKFLVTGEVIVRLVEGDHHSMIDAQHAASFATTLEEAMRETEAKAR